MLLNTPEYLTIVTDIKKRIKAARHSAVLAANSELIALYWNIGKTIGEHSTWGSKFIDNLARDIRLEFPNATGYSVRNLKYMAKFAKTYPNFEFVQTVPAQIAQVPLAQIIWCHNTEDSPQ